MLQWLLDIDLRTSGRTVSAPNCWVISPAQSVCLLTEQFQIASCTRILQILFAWTLRTYAKRVLCSMCPRLPVIFLFSHTFICVCRHAKVYGYKKTTYAIFMIIGFLSSMWLLDIKSRLPSLVASAFSHRIISLSLCNNL